MFSTGNNVKSILFCGSNDATKSFMFEIAIHWAEEGRRVFYITSAPLTSIPAVYHDRNEPLPTAFNMIKFIYLSNYEELVVHLVELHTHAVLPSVLLIDNLHTYINDAMIKEQQDIHIARLCAILHDTMNSCSRIKKIKLHLCASLTTTNLNVNTYHLYFNDIWNVDSNDVEGVKTIQLKQISGELKNESHSIFQYKQFQDDTLILNQIIRTIEKD